MIDTGAAGVTDTGFDLGGIVGGITGAFSGENNQGNVDLGNQGGGFQDGAGGAIERGSTAEIVYAAPVNVIGVVPAQPSNGCFMPECPPGMACVQVCPGVTGVIPANGAAAAPSPLQQILGPVTGALGGVGRQFGVGTAGTRLVADQGGGGNIARTLGILLLVAAVGYILYKRYYKKGKAAD